MRESSEPKRRDPLKLPFVIFVLVLLLAGAGLGLRVLLSQDRSAGCRPASRLGTRQNTPLTALPRACASRNGRRRPNPRRLQRLPLAVPRSLRLRPQGGEQATRDVIFLPYPHRPRRTCWRYPPTGPGPTTFLFGPAWQKAGQLFYQTQAAEQGKLGARMSWTPGGGQTSTWFLGIVEADHPTHANTRFPGFFMHAAYLPKTLGPGARLLWEFPWQGGDGRAISGRVRRFDVKVAGWERVEVPAGTFDAARLEGTLRYVEDEQTRAEVRYTLWYSGHAKQVVRLVWLGRSPDEGNGEMLAELASYLAPN